MGVTDLNFREKYLPVYFNLNLISLFRRKNAMKNFLFMIALIMIATLLVVPGVQTSAEGSYADLQNRMTTGCMWKVRILLTSTQ